jgi:hypothetical protein
MARYVGDFPPDECRFLRALLLPPVERTKLHALRAIIDAWVDHLGVDCHEESRCDYISADSLRENDELS